MSINLDLVQRSRATELLLASNSPFKQGIGQLKALMFIGAGIEGHQRIRAETFEFTNVVFAKPTTIV